MSSQIFTPTNMNPSFSQTQSSSATNNLQTFATLTSKRLDLMAENVPWAGLPDVNSSPNFRGNSQALLCAEPQSESISVVAGSERKSGIFKSQKFESNDATSNYYQTPSRSFESTQSLSGPHHRTLPYSPRAIESPDQVLASELQALHFSFASLVSSSQSIIVHNDDQRFYDSDSAAGSLVLKFSCSMLLSCFELFQAISGLSLFTTSSSENLRQIKFVLRTILSSISELHAVIQNIKQEFHALEDIHMQRLGRRMQQHCHNMNHRKLKLAFNAWFMTTVCLLQQKQSTSAQEIFSILTIAQAHTIQEANSEMKRKLGEAKFQTKISNWKVIAQQKATSSLKSNWIQAKKLKQKSKTVIFRIMNMRAASCFTQWMHHVHMMKRARKSMSTLLKKSMVCCFYAWQEHVAAKKETDKRLQVAGRKILGRWMHGGASRSFERWLAFVQDAKATSFRLAREHALSLKQSHYVELRVQRFRMFCLGLHFHFFRRHFKTRRSLKHRLRHMGFVNLRSFFCAWFSVVNAFKIQRDDEFTISVLKSISNFPLQHYLEQHATKRIHTSRSAFCKSFQIQIESLNEKARIVVEMMQLIL